MVTKAMGEENLPTRLKEIKENSIGKRMKSLIEKALKELEDCRIIVEVVMINLEEEMGINQIISIDKDQVQEIDKTEVGHFKVTIKDLLIEIIIIMIEGKIININQTMA